ncbi:TolC family protein [Anaeromyxobacter oryzae]|uniref:Outer membrane protein TolC n=1 Tax=Anaeromyxobacter oryzae TaxID=2918170 RepID=A0ABM7X025_9BACT|nr:TolC family protein [Anaeromyxobacter oryzae]BDG05140.1 outer membrane protein TolC [Anaeromyxobacter oryzae]
MLVPLLLAVAQQPQASPPPAPPPPPDLRPALPGPSSARVLSLAEAERSALERQPQLAQARSTTEAASARADQARAPLLPQVSGTASYQRLTGNFVARPGSFPTTGGGTTTSRASWGTTDYYAFGLTASQLVWDFGQTSGRWRSAQALATAQRDSERATEVQVLLTVRAAFFGARAQRDLVHVASDTLANQEAHLRQVEGFVRAGTRPEVDLWQARTDRANAQVQLINAENAYAIARAQLNQAMGVTGSTDYEVASDTLPPVEEEDGIVDALVPEAERNRPDLVSLEEQARAQDLTAGALQGGYGPSLGISTGFTDAGPTIGSTVWNWNATATLTWNLFQGGLTRAQVQEARANGSAVRAEAEVLRQQIRVDVDQARLAVRAAKSSLGAANDALTNSKERLRQAERRYQLGVGSLIDLGDAQLAETAAAAQLVQAEFNLSTSRAQLLRALGREVQRG